MNLSSLSKSLLFNLTLLAVAIAQGVTLYTWKGELPEAALYVSGAILLLACFTLYYSIKAMRFTNRMREVCDAIRKGDFEERVINRSERGGLGKLADALNGAIDVNDAFVRESALAMQAASDGRYYRKIRPEGMRGAFLNSLTGINSAIDLLADKDAADARNKEMIALTMEEIKNLVDAASEGDLQKRIDTEQFTDAYKDLTERMNGLMDTIVEPINAIISTLETLAGGDLTRKMEGSYFGSFGDMKEAVNNTIEQLVQMVGQIKEVADSVSTSASEITLGSQDLSHRTESQASTLEETAASMEELTGAVRQNTDNAQDASKIANDANNVAQKGGEIVRNAIDAMSRIQESSQKIADIIGVIDEIAFQTNLLALNASVEAARAGEAGKGFAVVADEVRTLAGRSAEASKEIKDLISNSVEQVKSGVDLVNQSGASLGEIVSSIQNVTGLVTNIAEASQEQSAGINEINTAVSQMDEATQQNAALVEESTAAAQSMTEQASALTKLITFFRTSKDDAVVARPVAHIANDAGHAGKTPAANVLPHPSVAKKAMNGSANGYDQGWEEF